MAGDIRMGLLPSEIVVRGGGLSQPVIVENVRVIQGRQFVSLKASSSWLCRFLSGQGTSSRPLVKTNSLDRLAALRNARFSELLNEAAKDVSPPADDDLSGKLGLDDDDNDHAGDQAGAAEGSSQEQKHPGKQKSPAKPPRKTMMAQMPPWAEVKVVAGDFEWVPILVMEGATKAPSMEATAANFRNLYQFVTGDLAEGLGQRVRERHGAGKHRPEPRGSMDERMYAVGRCWVTKIKETTPDGKKHLRTLKRLRSDEKAATQRTKRTPSEMAPLTDGAEVVEDCLT